MQGISKGPRLKKWNWGLAKGQSCRVGLQTEILKLLNVTVQPDHKNMFHFLINLYLYYN